MEKQNDSIEDIIAKTEKQKNELIERLVSFVCHDTILYLPEYSAAKKYLCTVNAFLNTDFQMCEAFTTAEINFLQKNKLTDYLDKLSACKLAGLYISATELRSVLLGILLVEKKLDVDEAFACGFAEEIEEQKKWGQIEETIQRHTLIKERLKCAERMINA